LKSHRLLIFLKLKYVLSKSIDIAERRIIRKTFMFLFKNLNNISPGMTGIMPDIIDTAW
jgi:hypothetical protein